MVRVIRADWGADGEAIRAVRLAVFVEEQKVPLDLEMDGRDPECAHVLALDAQGAVGTGRLLPDGHIGRMAVLADWRGRGLGSKLLDELVQIARERGMRRVELHAQVHAIPFYQRAGFAVVSGEFMDAGIPHRTMARDL
jgi:predicted GNAT family N-acyltransferase